MCRQVARVATNAETRAATNAQLKDIDGRADDVTYNTLQVSFLKWNKEMIGNTAPTEYVVT